MYLSFHQVLFMELQQKRLFTSHAKSLGGTTFIDGEDVAEIV